MMKALAELGPNPTTLAHFRDSHGRESVMVCGCGPSLRVPPGGLPTIGVNDIGRPFTPIHPVVVNPPGQFRSDGFQYVRVSQAKTLFTQLDLGRTARGVLPARAVRRHRQRQRRRRAAPHPELPLRGCLPGRVHGCCAHRPHPPSAQENATSTDH